MDNFKAISWDADYIETSWECQKCRAVSELTDDHYVRVKKANAQTIQEAVIPMIPVTATRVEKPTEEHYPKKETPSSATNLLAGIGVLAVVVVLILVGNIALNNAGYGGDSGILTIAAMAVIGIGWWLVKTLDKASKEK